MGLPNVTDNYKGYEDSDLSKHAEKLRDKQFLMVSPLASNSLGKHTYIHTMRRAPRGWSVRCNPAACG